MIHFRASRAVSLYMALVGVTLVGCGSDDPTGNGNGNGNGDGNGGPPVETTSVSVVDFDFNPDDIQVAPGATVTWTWQSTSYQHHLVWIGANTQGLADSGLKTTGTHEVTMPTTPGTYNYNCQVHGTAMSGSVVVSAQQPVTVSAGT